MLPTGASDHLRLDRYREYLGREALAEYLRRDRSAGDIYSRRKGMHGPSRWGSMRLTWGCGFVSERGYGERLSFSVAGLCHFAATCEEGRGGVLKKTLRPPPELC